MRWVQEELVQDVAKVHSLGALLTPTPAFVITLFYVFLFIYLFTIIFEKNAVAFTHR